MRPAPRGTRPGHDRPFHYVDFHRTIATLLLVVAAVLAAVSINGPWWAESRIATSEVTYQQVQSITLSFDLNGGLACSAFGWQPTPCQNVTGSMNGTLVSIFAGVDVALYALVGLGILAAGFLTAGALGKTFGRIQLRLAIAFALGLGVIALAVTVGTAVIGPGPQASALCEVYSGNLTGCSGYWGGTTAGVIPGGCLECATNFGWGASWSWYYTLGAGIASSGAWYLLWRGRRGPFTQREHALWALENRPFELSSPAPAPPPTPVSGPPSNAIASLPSLAPVASRGAIPYSEDRRTRWICRRCQTVNSPWAKHCGACGATHPADAPRTDRR